MDLVFGIMADVLVNILRAYGFLSRTLSIDQIRKLLGFPIRFTQFTQNFRRGGRSKIDLIQRHNIRLLV